MRKKKLGPGGEIEKDPNIKGPIGYLNSYFNSPMFKKRLTENSEQSYDSQMKLFSDASNKYKPFILEKDPDEIGSRVGNPSLNKVFGNNIPTDANIILSKPQADSLNADLLSNVLPHEYSHTIRNLGFLDNLNFAFSNKNPKAEQLFTQWTSDKTRKSDDNYGTWLEKHLPNAHDIKPNEQYSDLNSLRYLMYQQGIYDTRKGDLDLPTLKKALEDPYIKKQFNTKRLLENFTPEKIVELNNQVAQNNNQNTTPMAKSGIHIDPSKKGTFTAAAKKHGKSVQGFASQVLAHKENYSPAMVKKANFARNASKWHKGEDGLVINPGDIGNTILSGIDMLLPQEQIHPPVVRPFTTTNPQAYGIGSSALMKFGGKLSYAEGGKTEEKVSLNMNKHKTNPELYIPFGKDAQLAYDEGWYPVTNNKGQVTYNSDYDLFNTVMAPRKNNKNIPAPGGKVVLVGNSNGIFDVIVNDVDGNAVKTLAKGVPFSEANKFITRPDNIVAQRQQQIMKTTQPNNPETAMFAKGGKLTPSKAAEILHDGTAQGHKLTDKQRRFFGWKSHQKAENGMQILDDNTVEFHGDKHSDPSGGIPMAAHGKQVLVEDDETAYVSPIDKSVNVMGNMTNPLTGNKYKNDSKKLADKQSKVEKYITNGSLIVDNVNPTDRWDILKFNAGKAMMQGGTFRKNQIIAAKEHLAEMQQAHLEVKNPEKAKYGIKLAGDGIFLDNNPTLEDVKGNSAFNYDNSSLFEYPTTRALHVDNSVSPLGILSTAFRENSPSYTVDNSSNIEVPMPTNATGLSFSQIAPELYAAATNKQEGVFSQSFTPELYSPYSISLQDRRNAATSQFRASSQYLGDNPAAQAQLAAQAYNQTNEANADEFRTNQGIFNDINNKNIQLMNEAKSNNLNISDRAYTRQQQAKSNTKAQNRVILQSIADKMHQNKLEQEIIKLYENLYNFRFNDGKAQNYNQTDLSGHGIVGNLAPISPEQRVEVKTKSGNTETKTVTDPASVIKSREYTNKLKQLGITQQQRNNLAYKFNLSR